MGGERLSRGTGPDIGDGSNQKMRRAEDRSCSAPRDEGHYRVLPCARRTEPVSLSTAIYRCGIERVPLIAFAGRDEGDVLQPALLERSDLTLTLRHT
jgi:hypothetical protein